jgi:hypothetical protein
MATAGATAVGNSQAGSQQRIKQIGIGCGADALAGDVDFRHCTIPLS